jgi:hypothetical protein
MEKDHADDGEIVFVNMHAVAEAHRVNTWDAAVAVARRAGSKAAVLEDITIDGLAASETWRTFHPKWSPWSIVIGKDGKILYNGDTPRKKDLREILRKALGRKRKK